MIRKIIWRPVVMLGLAVLAAGMWGLHGWSKGTHLLAAMRNGVVEAKGRA